MEPDLYKAILTCEKIYTLETSVKDFPWRYSSYFDLLPCIARRIEPETWRSDRSDVIELWNLTSLFICFYF
jgi:hypothetical protein